MLLAETVFAALITAALLFLVRIDAGEGCRYDALIAGPLMGGSLLALAAGVGTDAGGFLALTLQRQWRAPDESALGALLVAVPGFVGCGTRERSDRRSVVFIYRVDYGRLAEWMKLPSANRSGSG